MLVAPGLEIRQEGSVVETPFGATSETPVSAIMKELHVHSVGDKTVFSLENPVVGGPVVVCHDKVQQILVPGEQITVDHKNITVMLQKEGHTQILILD